MRDACLAPSFHQKRGEMDGGWQQADILMKISHFYGTLQYVLVQSHVMETQAVAAVRAQCSS